MNLNPSVLLDICIGTKDLGSLIKEALDAIEVSKTTIVFACATPHSLARSRTDPILQSALNDADQVVADGVGVSLMARVTGIDVGPRITGSDYFFAVMNALNERGSGRVFFFGSSETVLNRIGARMKHDFPNLTLCGVISPPYRAWSNEENEAMVAQINAAQSDVLWVGMTAPKQEKWVYQNRHKLQVPVIGSIGAVFGFFAGTNPRAPMWMCHLGIEWFYRLIREPRRMWRRNFVSTPQFVFLVLWNHILLRRRHGLRLV